MKLHGALPALPHSTVSRPPPPLYSCTHTHMDPIWDGQKAVTSQQMANANHSCLEFNLYSCFVH
jgi:hypothetical protein